MSKGGGGGGSTTQVQKADPWVGLQPALSTLYGSALKNYQSGGPQYYPGQTLAGSNPEIDAALNMGDSLGSQGPSQVMQAGNASLQGLMGGHSLRDNPAFGTLEAYQNGQMQGQNPAQNTFAQFAHGDLSGGNPAQGTFDDFASGKRVGQNSAEGFFGDTMAGKFLTNNTNPYLNGLYNSATRPMTQQFQNSIAPALASQFSAAGRTGSGAHQEAFGQASDALARGLGDTANNLFGGAYENERNRQQQAGMQMSQMNQFDRTQQMQGAQEASNLFNTGLAQRMQGAQGLAGIFSGDQANQMRGAEDISSQYGQDRTLNQAATLAAPGFAQASQNLDFDRIAKLMGVGQYRQGQQQDAMNDQKARWDYNQQLPTQNLQALNQLLQGGSAYNSQSSKGTSATNRNPFAGAVGGLATTAALGNAIGGEFGGAMLGPMGLIGGSLLGGLFG